MNSIEQSTGSYDLSALIQEFGTDDFKPFAYYDKHLDTIRVQIKDCSSTEVRLSQYFTMMEANFPTNDGMKYLGFNIKGIKHLFSELGIDLEGVVLLTKIIGDLIELYPDEAVQQVAENFNAILDDAEVEVNFAKAA